jgi:hypothetical protein
MNCFLRIEAKGRSFCDKCLLKHRGKRDQKLRYMRVNGIDWNHSESTIKAKGELIRLTWKTQSKRGEQNKTKTGHQRIEDHFRVQGNYRHITDSSSNTHTEEGQIITRAPPQTKLNMKEKYDFLPKQPVFSRVKQDGTVT